jgi:hypothetical protein
MGADAAAGFLPVGRRFTRYQAWRTACAARLRASCRAGVSSSSQNSAGTEIGFVLGEADGQNLPTGTHPAGGGFGLYAVLHEPPPSREAGTLSSMRERISFMGSADVVTRHRCGVPVMRSSRES